MSANDIFDKITEKANEGYYEPKLPYAQRGDKGGTAYGREKQRLEEEWMKDITKYIKTSLGRKFTQKRCDAIYNYSERENHSAGRYEVLIGLPDLLTLAKTIL